jgi:hypothetical protein
MFKRTNSSSDWVIFDSMRGLTTSGNNGDRYLYPNQSTAEGGLEQIGLTATGFVTEGSWGEVNASGGNYIYVAIRRPHKPAEEFAATDLFEMDYDGGAILNNSAKDFMFNKNVTSSVYFEWGSRLQGTNCLNSGSTGAEFSAPELVWSNKVLSSDGDGRNYYMFRRAPGFCDVVAYTGNGSGTHNVSHNLGVKPELVICKSRSTGGTGYNWPAITDTSVSSAATLFLNTSSSNAGGSSSGMFTDTTVNVGSTAGLASLYGSNQANQSSVTYIMYLFATVPGISKVGSYTGTGTNQNIDCGFSTGARFVAIKRTDASGPWEIYSTDIFKGINAGAADQHNFWNTNTRVYTEDNLDPYSGGFRVNGTASADVNASGGSYIFLAIA